MDRLVGANLYFVEKEKSYMTQLNQTRQQMADLAKQIKLVMFLESHNAIVYGNFQKYSV